MSSCNCMLSELEIATYTSTNVCMMITQNGTYPLGNSVAFERQVDTTRVLFAYLEYLLESFGFKTCQFGASQL